MPQGIEVECPACRKKGIGEIALLRRANRLSTVTTETPCLLLAVAREHFLDLIENARHVRESMELIVDEYLEAWAARDAQDPAREGT